MIQYEYSQPVYCYIGEQRMDWYMFYGVTYRLSKVGTIYRSSVTYINGRQMCALTFAGQRKCGAFGTVVPSAVLWVVVLVSTAVLTSNICTVW
jgi:hypothetical protein